MRGDAGLTARLLLRGEGLAGMTIAVGGCLVVAASLQPWYAVVADVAMLGHADERTVATLRGLPATAAGWLAAALGVAIVALGLLLAFDRTPLHGRAATLGASAATALVAGIATLTVPALEVIAADASDGLLVAGQRLPVGVDVELRAVAAAGPRWAALGAVMAALGAVSARDR